MVAPPKSQISLPITGMTCAACVVHVSDALEEVGGVEQVSVNLATEKAALELRSDDIDLLHHHQGCRGRGLWHRNAQDHSRHRRDDLRGVRDTRGERAGRRGPEFYRRRSIWPQNAHPSNTFQALPGSPNSDTLSRTRAICVRGGWRPE